MARYIFLLLIYGCGVTDVALLERPSNVVWCGDSIARRVASGCSSTPGRRLYECSLDLTQNTSCCYYLDGSHQGDGCA